MTATAARAGTNPVEQAVVWLNDPLNWTNPGGILDRLGEHLSMSAAAVLLGCLVAWPIGLWLGHSGRGGGLVLLISNVTLAIPTLALLTILPLTFLGFGRPAVVVALAVFAVPPLLANAYTGVRQADPEARDAAVQVVATAALASFVNGGGLGQIIRAGFGLDIAAGGGQIIAGGVLVAGLSLLVEGVLALVERAVTPRPLRRARGRANRRAAAAVAGN